MTKTTYRINGHEFTTTGRITEAMKAYNRKMKRIGGEKLVCCADAWEFCEVDKNADEFAGLFDGPEMMKAGLVIDEEDTDTDTDTDSEPSQELINNMLNVAYYKVSLNHCSECGEYVVTGATEHMCATCNTELCERCAANDVAEFGQNFSHDIYLEPTEPLNCQACG